jgi:hypothetical protein
VSVTTSGNIEMNKRIRIIKPAERDAQRDHNDRAVKQESVSPPEIESSRDTATIITSWIGEFRQRKRTELAVAYALKNSITKTA